MKKKVVENKVVFEKQETNDSAEHVLNSGRFHSTVKVNKGNVEATSITSGMATYIFADGDEIPDFIKILRRTVEIYDAYDALRPAD